jgi:centromere protein I
VRNLYPASKVPDSIVCKLIGSLGHGRNKPSYATQAALLKWVVMIYEILENQTVLARLYSVLFNLLDTIATRYSLSSRVQIRADDPRPQLCHVLSLITRRRHVRPFRIQAL